MGDRRIPGGGDTLLSGRLADMAAARRPGDSVFGSFVAEYYRELPEFDVDDRLESDLYAAALAHFGIGRQRSGGKSIVEVLSPDHDRDGWHSDRSVVLIITNDVPFLVDTVRIVLERHGINTHLLVHPMLRVRRDAACMLQGVAGIHEEFGVSVEAWTQIEIDRCDPERAEHLRVDLRDAIELVHRVVADFGAMRERLTGLARHDALLTWLAEGNFVFLGAATYDLTAGDPVCRADSALGQLTSDSPVDPAIVTDGPVVSLARSAELATIHRLSRMTVVTILGEDERGRPVAERFVGLLASTAYRQSVLTIPSVGDRARSVLGLAAQGAENHTGRSMRNVLETLPRDLVFELDADRLAELVIDVVGLQERQIVRVFEVPEPVGRSSTVLVYLPKGRFTAQLPEDVADFVGEAFGSSTSEVASLIGASSLARVTFTITDCGDELPDLDELSDAVDELTTSWVDRVLVAAEHRMGEARAASLVARIASVAPSAYRTRIAPTTAIGDLERIAQLIDSGDVTRTALMRDIDDPRDEWRIRVYRRDSPVALSTMLPLLTHLGFETIEQHPYRFFVGGHRCHLYDITVRVPPGVGLDDHSHAELLVAFEGLLDGSVEPDGFNRLVMLAGLSTPEVNLLRSYARYAHQTSFAFSQGYVEGSLQRSPELARLLVRLFEARFDPDRDSARRDEEVASALEAAERVLDAVPSLDDDRIGRTFLALIMATVRTSAYQDRSTLAFKFDPTLVPDLPEPVPAHEIFVCSSRVEGIHLRGGAIARGGLRWSDRPEDYRTEVLGLVKAQMVKNAVIVPVGAKGGFVVKRPKATPAEHRDEVVECYRMFVRGLLDLTDNVVAGEIVPPDRMVRYDGDDPYLVVAADKGTASFSDIANEVASEYEFWLGDAFASGGSEGYDHKVMAITARGAWESVKRHGTVIGIDPEVDEITMVGIGDMSGDVFGNGLLRSHTVKLVAAFDHRDIFIDPDPDPERSFQERLRLFETPRSTWADYDDDLISPGGGVFSRSLKSITITPEMASALDIDAKHLTPNQLISEVLRAPVDLLWNGGVGTYVKASSESDAHVGDRANDAVRIDAAELRCRILAEGGNLGVTQLGRVEFAINDGLIYTDAIDNSAGVDCSDHEVNIKILLGAVVQDGELTLKQRNHLLTEMTEEVGELVLANNRAQTLALVIARTQGVRMVNVHMRYLDQLELEGWLDRAIEFLPSDKQLAERLSLGSGLRAPEFSVLIAYTKNVLVTEILQTDLPESHVLEQDLIDYFPIPLRERYRDEILHHRLRRDITTTVLVNQMVNLSGISYDHRMTEDTGASASDVARAWLVTREVLGFAGWWDEIEAVDGIDREERLEMFRDCRRTAERCSLWFLRHRRPPVDIDAEIERFQAPLRAFKAELFGCLTGPILREAQALGEQRRAAGVPDDLAERSVVWRLLHTTFDVIELADRVGVPPMEAAHAYWDVFDRFDLLWLWNGIGALPRFDRWQTQARSALRDESLIAIAGLASNVLEHGSVESWVASNERSVLRADALLTEIRRADSLDISNLSVALRQLQNLALTSIREP